MHKQTVLVPPQDEARSTPMQPVASGGGQVNVDPPMLVPPQDEAQSTPMQPVASGGGQVHVDPPMLVPPQDEAPSTPMQPVASEGGQAILLESIPVDQPKRKGNWSPASSPHKLGKIGPKRRRTVTVHGLHATRKCITDIPLPNTLHQVCPITSLTLEGFQESSEEQSEREGLESKTFRYMLSKEAFQQEDDTVLKELKFFFALCDENQEQNPSNMYYMEIIDENPDSNDTMRHIAEILLENVTSNNQGKYVILVGDGKTYEHLMKIKQLYGSELDKLLIFPGDWHTLYNYQPVLMKIYYSVGLKELAKSAGFRGETLTSLEKCSHFKRTHHFLLQVWQGMYRQMLRAYMMEKQDAFPQLSTLYTAVQDKTPKELLTTVECLLNDTHQKAFQSFIQKSAQTDDTWKFWSQFILQDCLAYVGLFLAIRCQNWNLRVSSLKRMAPLFAAYDRTTYQRLIPNHLADIQTYPAHILQCMQSGGFAVSITGSRGHSVALDEAHEMCINRDMKAAVVRPTRAYLQKTSLFLRYRIAAYKNILQQLFPAEPNSPSEHAQNCLTTNEPEIREREENTLSMLKDMDKSGLLPHNVLCNRGLRNVFTGTAATPEQAHDLLNFRKIGTEDLSHFITHHILRKPSTVAPVRRNRLLTMAAHKQGKRRMSHKEREFKQVTKCLRQRLAWCNRTGQSYNPAYEQYSLFPRAISDENGYPRKGTKSSWTDHLGKRYNSPHMPVLLSNLPQGWTPHAVIVDGMFIINCQPLRHISTVAEYATLLFNRFVSPHYQAGAMEVHLVFDSPSDRPFSPKCYERKRRDESHSNPHHTHLPFTPSTKIPQQWRAYIECRQCKRAIVKALGLAYLQSARFRLRQDQRLILSGCIPESRGDVPWVISGGSNLPVPDLKYLSNAEEADMRIWRHATQTSAERLLVYSPDTDVYNIGLPIIKVRSLSVQCIVQLNVPHSQELKYLHINNLLQALEDDPDLATLPRESLPTILQILFICSGCDYISYFNGFGKASFLKTFCQHAPFITGNQLPGILSETTKEGLKRGFLAFLRLIGTLYFKKHLSSFVSLHGVPTPNQLYNSMDPAKSVEERHKVWYSEIRSIVSERICNEEERVPSYTAMWRHWLRSCWVAEMWSHSIDEDMYCELNEPDQSGWKQDEDGSYIFDWDSQELQQKVQETICFLTKGCSCKKGCKTKQCGCRKKGRHCGPGCDCHGCTNLTTSTDTDGTDNHSLPVETADEGDDTEQENEGLSGCEDNESEDDESGDDEAEGEGIETEIITDTFDHLLLEQYDVI